MKTTEIGREAEAKVASFLESEGYKILDRNWRTRVCEIDIIAKKDQIVYFAEVKYRSSDKQGKGLDYITAQKLHKLHFAAEIWVQNYQWNGDYRLLAAEVSENKITEIVEIE